MMPWDANLTSWDVAVVLDVSLRSVWWLVNKGKLPAIVVPPGVLRFRQVDVDGIRGRA